MKLHFQGSLKESGWKHLTQMFSCNNLVPIFDEFHSIQSQSQCKSKPTNVHFFLDKTIKTQVKLDDSLNIEIIQSTIKKILH